MASADVQGKFLWHELITTDPGAAGAFYGKVLGWTPQAWDKDPSYTVLLTPKGPVGGIMKVSPEMQAGGVSPHWLAYVGVASVDETAAAAQRLGGRVIKGGTDIPGGGGRYAILGDPHGGVIGVHSMSASSAGSGGGGQGPDAFAWHELGTADHAAAFKFYRELFGWEQLRVHDLGAMGPYLIFGRAGQELGGIFNRPASASGSQSQWLAYARVNNAAKAADAVKSAGGRVVNGPMQVPGGSWVVQIVDPHGAAIAVNQPATEAPQAAKAAAAPAKPAPSAPAASTGSAKPAGGAAPSPASPAVAAKPAKPTEPAKAAKAAPVAAAKVSASAPAAAEAPAAERKPAGRKPPRRKAAPSKSASAAVRSRGGGAAKRKAKRAGPARKTAAAAKRASAARRTPASRSKRGGRSRTAKTSSGASRRGGRRSGGSGSRKTGGRKVARKKVTRRAKR
jgi:predicted enzyme related to lactoylglutathione lyase